MTKEQPIIEKVEDAVSQLEEKIKLLAETYDPEVQFESCKQIIEIATRYKRTAKDKWGFAKRNGMDSDNKVSEILRVKEKN